MLQPAATWGWNEILTNKMVYLLEVLIWQKSKDAQKKAPSNKPALFVPEFMRSLEAENNSDGVNKDMEAHTTDDIRDILARPRL